MIEEVKFSYDVLGNRVEKDVDANGDGVFESITKFAYDLSGNAWADLTSGGSLTTRRVYEDAVDKLFARIGSSNNPAFYLTDLLGSVRDIVNGSGSLIDNLSYDSYGTVTTETSPANGDRYAWTSRERDSEINLQYNRARYYDPSTGRWISQDPLGFDAGDGNLSRYVNNTPISAVDPTGMVEFEMVIMTFIPEKEVLAVSSNPIDVFNPFQMFTRQPTAMHVYKGDNRGFTKGDPMKEENFRTRVHVKIDTTTKNYWILKGVPAKDNPPAGTGKNDWTLTSTVEAGQSERHSTAGELQVKQRAKEGVDMHHDIKATEREIIPSISLYEGHVYEIHEEAWNPVHRGIVNPAIDYHLDLVLSWSKTGTLSYRLSGNHDGFPNYEVYARAGGKGPWSTVYQYDHNKTGKGPMSLFGSGDEEIDVSGEWKNLAKIK